jgi:hypothetical protein
MVLITAVCSAAACGGAATEAPATSAAREPAVDPATAGTITGRVLVGGTLPADHVVRIDGDPACVALNGRPDRPLGAVVPGDAGTLQNVFVYVKETMSGRRLPAPKTPAVLDQQKCAYIPRVVGVQVDQALAIRNSDALMHNIRSESEINQPFNFSQPVAGITTERRFATREVMVLLKCDVHAWMRAYVGVLDHPFFAVTGQAGTFALSGVPPGSYTIEAWHETLGTASTQVTLAASDAREITLTFAAGRLEGPESHAIESSVPPGPSSRLARRSRARQHWASEAEPSRDETIAQAGGSEAPPR